MFKKNFICEKLEIHLKHANKYITFTKGRGKYPYFADNKADDNKIIKFSPMDKVQFVKTKRKPKNNI